MTRENPATTAEPSAAAADTAASTNTEAPTKRAEIVVQTVTQHAEIFSNAGIAFATIARDKREETLKLRSRRFKTWTAWIVREQEGCSVGNAALEEALLVLEGQALHDRPVVPVHVRVAGGAGCIWIDLADDIGTAVQVTSRGWSIATRSPVKFLRSDNMLPLPRPLRGGDVAELRSFLNVESEADFTLVVAWLVATFQPERPFAVLVLQGEQGSGKTTASRVLRALTDPSLAPVLGVPRREDDLLVTATHTHVVALDNMSGVSPALSDALCRLATGGGLSKRRLFTDDEETTLRATKPLLLNGIDDVVNRADLADRSLLVRLVPPRRRLDEERYWKLFDRAAPRIFGALLDGVVAALGNVGREPLGDLPRMADFGRWATAAEAGLRFERGSVLRALGVVRERTVDVALDASPVAVAVRRVLADSDLCPDGLLAGTPSEIHDRLTMRVGDELRRSREWPKAAHVFTAQLRRARSFLREIGIVVEDSTRGRGSAKQRWLTLRLEQRRSEATAASPVEWTPQSSDHHGSASPDGPGTQAVHVGAADPSIASRDVANPVRVGWTNDTVVGGDARSPHSSNDASSVPGELTEDLQPFDTERNDDRT